MNRILLIVGISLMSFGFARGQFVTTWAGTGVASSSGTGVAKASANIGYPFGIARDSKGNTWISCFDTSGLLIMIGTDNKYYIRGGSTSPITGFKDGNGAGASEFSYCGGIAVDKNDTIFVADYGNCAIRRISPFSSLGSSQKITTIAGGGGNLNSSPGITGYHEGQGTDSVSAKVPGALFNGPIAIAIYPSGNNFAGDIIVADLNNYVIRGVKRSGKTYLIAGQPGSANYVDGPPTGTALSDCHFNAPSGVYIDPTTFNIYVTEQNSRNIRVIPYNSSTGKYDKNTFSINISTKLATGVSSSKINDYNLNGLIHSNANNSANTFYFADGSSVIYNDLKNATTTGTGIIAGSPLFSKSTLTGGDSSGFVDNVGGSKALFTGIAGMVDISTSKTDRHLLVTDFGNNRIRNIDLNGSFTGIEEDAMPVSDKGEGFKIYPNPANEYFILENKGLGGSATIAVYDMAGKLVSFYNTDFNNNFVVPVTTFPKGIYIVKAQTEKEIFTGKVIVTK